jgi:hypothetical protein
MTEDPAFICSHIFDNTRPVLLVMNTDGDWQFLCGGIHEGETPRVVGINHLLDRDPSLRSVLDLPNNWEAERESLWSPWQRRPIVFEE